MSILFDRKKQQPAFEEVTRRNLLWQFQFLQDTISYTLKSANDDVLGLDETL